MTVPTDPKVGDVGTALRPTIVDGGDPVDVSGATVLQVVLEKPDGTTERKSASLATDGTDGTIEYITVDGDFNQVGTYRIMGYVELPGGSWSSETASLSVTAPLDAPP